MLLAFPDRSRVLRLLRRHPRIIRAMEEPEDMREGAHGRMRWGAVRDQTGSREGVCFLINVRGLQEEEEMECDPAICLIRRGDSHRAPAVQIGERIAERVVRAAGRAHERGGEIIRAPSAEKCWDDVSRWRLLFAADWERPEHINILEVRTIVNLARHLARSSGGRHKRTLVSRTRWWRLESWARD